MRLGWAIVAGVLFGSGLAWWVSRDTPQEAQRKEQRAQDARAAQAKAARPALYRWRDQAGVLQVTSEPPRPGKASGKVERLDTQPREGIEVHGDRP